MGGQSAQTVGALPPHPALPRKGGGFKEGGAKVSAYCAARQAPSFTVTSTRARASTP
jgi:hypothetical protein